MDASDVKIHLHTMLRTLILPDMSRHVRNQALMVTLADTNQGNRLTEQYCDE
jgi:hypothetical protein